MPGPLEGVRVIDFGRYIAAPYCGMLLADLGADVIRVERREGGEDRMVGPVTKRGEGGMFHNINRNKRGITLSLGTPGSQDVVNRLVASADVVIMNLPIKSVEKLGLTYESLKEIKEDIIMVLGTAYGTTGPYAHRVGFDGIAQAMSGAMHLTGEADGPPTRDIVPFVDYGTALHAAVGTISALYKRKETGRGQMIEVSLLETSITYMTALMAEYQFSGIKRERTGNAGYFAAPSNTFKAKDGWILVPTVGNYMFARWAKMVGHEEMIDDPRFKDDLARGNNQEIINDLMSQWCAQRTRAEVVKGLEDNRLPCGPVYDLDDVAKDEHIAARGIFEKIALDGEDKPVTLSHMPLRMSEIERKPMKPAPKLGQHTDDVLKEIGLSDAEIAKLKADEVV